MFLQRVDQILINALSLGQNQNSVQSKNAAALIVLRLLQMHLDPFPSLSPVDCGSLRGRKDGFEGCVKRVGESGLGKVL